MEESHTRTLGGLFAASNGEGATAPKALSAPMLGKFVAYSLAYAYMFCMFAGSAYLPSRLFSFDQTIACRLCLLLCGGLFLLIWRIVKLPVSPRRRHVVDTASLCASLLPSLALVAVNAGASVEVAYACWALAGFTLSHLYIKLTPWICQVQRGSTVAFMGAGCFIGALVFLLANLLVGPANLVLTVLLPFAAVIVGTRAERGDAIAPVSETSGKRRHARQSWDAVLYTLVQCSGLGLGLYCLLALADSWFPSWAVVLNAVSVGAAGMLLVVDWKALHLIDEERVSRYLYVAMFAPAAVIVFFHEPAALCACGCVLVVAMWVAALVGCSSEAESARAHNLRAQTALSRGWGFSLLGMGIGMLAGLVGLRWFGERPEVFAAIFTVAVLFVLAAVAISSGPGRERSAPAWEDRPVDFAADELVSEAVEESGDQTPAEAAEQLFADRCDVIGDTYGLSSRQREVFYLLVRGRDSKYIQSKLVISKGTADTHIHNIYRKLNVHSRQELLDLFEGDSA